MALSNAQHDSIMREYEQTKERNRMLLLDRQRSAYGRIPALEDLELSVGAAAAAQAKCLLEGDDCALERLRDLLSEIASRRRALLLSGGFPADYLDPVYDCPDCRDSGYLRLPDGSLEKCRCFRSRELAILYEQSNIREMIARENFSTLSDSYYKGEDLDRFTKAVKICRDFVQNFVQDYHNLFFYGTVGTGKSFLSGCVAGELLKQGHSVIYFSAAALFETLARYAFHTGEKENLSDFYQDLYRCDLLIIDDLGTEVTNSFIASQLFSCLNERHLRKRSTIISTNLSLAELRDRYSDRIFSRITSNYTVCKLTGPDIRMRRKIADA